MGSVDFARDDAPCMPAKNIDKGLGVRGTKLPSGLEKSNLDKLHFRTTSLILDPEVTIPMTKCDSGPVALVGPSTAQPR